MQDGHLALTGIGQVFMRTWWGIEGISAILAEPKDALERPFIDAAGRLVSA